MKKLFILLGLLIVIACQSQTVTYPGTRIFTGELQIATGAQFNFKGNYIVSIQTGDTIATIEAMRILLGNYLLETDTAHNSLLLAGEDTTTKIGSKHDDYLLNQKIETLNEIQITRRYYIDANTSDISGYEELLTTPVTFTHVHIPIAINNNTVILQEFATPANEPNVDTIQAGQWTFHAHADFNSITGDNFIHFDMYKRAAGGAETFLFRKSTDDIGITGVVEYNLNVIESAITIESTDRLVLKVLAQTTGGAKTATLHYSGDEHFAYVQPPLTFGSSMVYPGAGIPLSTGSAWGTSFPVSRLDSSYNYLNVKDSLIARNVNIYTSIIPGSIILQENNQLADINDENWNFTDGVDSIFIVPGIIRTTGVFSQKKSGVEVFKTDISGNVDITGEYRINGVPIIVLPDSFSISRRGVDFDSIVGLKLDRSESWYYNDTIRDTLRIHVDTSQIEGSANITIVADSTFTPTIDIYSKDATPVPIEQDSNSDPYDNTQGHRNEFTFYRNGDRIWFSITNKD